MSASLPELPSFKPKQKANQPLRRSPRPEKVRPAHKPMRQGGEGRELPVLRRVSPHLARRAATQEIRHACRTWLVETASKQDGFAGVGVNWKAAASFQSGQEKTPIVVW